MSQTTLNYQTVWKSRQIKIAACFVFAVQIFELLVFPEYRNYVSNEYGYTGLNWASSKYYAAFYLVYLFSSAVFILFVYLALRSSRVLQPFYAFIYGLINLYEFTYQGVYGRFSTIQDLRFASVVTSTQAFESVQNYVNLLGLFPTAAFLLLLILFSQKERLNLKLSFGTLAGFIALLISCNFLFWLAAPRFYQYEALNNSLGAGTRTSFGSLFTASVFQDSRRLEVKLKSPRPKPDNNIVLIVDESVRGDHLSLNGYHRPTTPLLDALRNNGTLHNWGIVAAGSTRSYESFRYLLTGIRTSDTSNIEKKAEELPTLFQYARAMGYETYYFDGQKDDYWAGETGDSNYLDVFLGKKYFDPLRGEKWEVDKRIAEKTRLIAESGRGKFIVIFKHGIHVPYDGNFPKTDAIWKPTSDRPIHNLQQGTREVLNNTYDNAVRFNLDVFFASLLTSAGEPPENTTIVYTSDHGQTLNEGGEIYTHGGRSKKEAAVPLFIIGELPLRVDTGFRPSHQNIFATILDLMRFPESDRKTSYAKSLLKATSNDNSPRFFFTPKQLPGESGTMETERLAFD